MLKKNQIWSLVVAVAVGLGIEAFSPSEAVADETVRVNMETRLRARKSERAPTIEMLNEGQVVKVLSRAGRWLRVSFRGKVGWIQRTQVEDEEESVSAREGRQKTTRDRRAQSNLRRRDKDFDDLGEDARGEDANEEAVDDEDPLDDGKKKTARKAKKSNDDDEEEIDDSEFEDEEPTASSDDEEEMEEEPRKPAKKSKKVASRGRSGIDVGEMVVFKKKTPIRMRPLAKAKPFFDARAGEEMEVIEIDDGNPNFVRVQSEDGNRGWAPRKALAMVGEGSVSSDDEDDEDVDDSRDRRGDDGDGSPRLRRRAKKEKMMIGVAANLGFLAKSQSMRTPGVANSLKGNYDLSNSAPAIVLGGVLSKRFGPKYEAGVEGSYLRSIGGKGITVAAGTMNETLGWVTQEIDASAVGGYWLSDKYLAVARVGYHIAQVVVQDSTTVELPGERISGIKVGAELRAPRLTPKISAHAGLETLVSAKLEQQEGKKDGATNSMSSYLLSVGATYQYKRNIQAMAGYELWMQSFTFSGASQREEASTSASRSDKQHVITVGAMYTF